VRMDMRGPEAGDARPRAEGIAEDFLGFFAHKGRLKRARIRAPDDAMHRLEERTVIGFIRGRVLGRHVSRRVTNCAARPEVLTGFGPKDNSRARCRCATLVSMLRFLQDAKPDPN